MTTLKAYTDLEQSHKLAEILPLESADMEYIFLKEGNVPVGKVPFMKDASEVENSAFGYTYNRTPCWSLAALIAILPINIKYKGKSLRLRLDLGEKDFNIWYDITDNGVASDIDVLADNPVDACVEMIIKLHKFNLL